MPYVEYYVLVKHSLEKISMYSLGGEDSGYDIVDEGNEPIWYDQALKYLKKFYKTLKEEEIEKIKENLQGGSYFLVSVFGRTRKHESHGDLYINLYDMVMKRAIGFFHYFKEYIILSGKVSDELYTYEFEEWEEQFERKVLRP